MEVFVVADRDDFEGVDDPNFFSTSERGFLVENIFSNIPILQKGQARKKMCRELHDLGASFEEGTKDVRRQSLTLRSVLEHNGFIDCVTPAHCAHQCNRLVEETLKTFTPLPVDDFRDYFVEEVAFHYAWMDMLTKWLTVPAAGSATVLVSQYWNENTIDTCSLTPLFGVGMFIWAVLFSYCWRRRERQLAYKWGTLEESGFTMNHFQTRPEFIGVLRKCPITEKMEMYYSPGRRLLKYACSAIMTAILLYCAFVVMIILLNLQGYVHPDHDRRRWESHVHPFYFPYFAGLTEEGQIFDSGSSWRGFLPVVLHGLCVSAMNLGYRSVAQKLTYWENHETRVQHQNS